MLNVWFVVLILSPSGGQPLARIASVLSHTVTSLYWTAQSSHVTPLRNKQTYASISKLSNVSIKVEGIITRACFGYYSRYYVDKILNRGVGIVVTDEVVKGNATFKKDAVRSEHILMTINLDSCRHNFKKPDGFFLRFDSITD